MIKGNFLLNIVDVPTMINYTLNPPEATYNEFDMVITRQGVRSQLPGVESAVLTPFIKVIFQRVQEQKNLIPDTIGLTLK